MQHVLAVASSIGMEHSSVLAPRELLSLGWAQQGWDKHLPVVTTQNKTAAERGLSPHPVFSELLK